MNSEPISEKNSDLPAELARPAWRALTGAGYWRLEQLTALTEAEIAKLHGIGPNAIRQLRNALTAKGLSFADDKRDEYTPLIQPSALSCYNQAGEQYGG